MCGILGIARLASASSPVIGEDAARRALGLLAHRGPDDEGIWWSPGRNVMLGHRRLSIIDLSAAGHQPMGNEDGTVQIVYNGEVYNFAELREELEARGHRFRSRTDTEVIVHGYEEYGPAIVEKLRGMFVFAVHDLRRERILLARDRLGIKPLYYTWTGGALAFASEIGPLLELPGVERKLNAAALREYLAFGKVYAPNTMFEGIEKFPAAHRAIVTAGGMTIERYWTPYTSRLDLPAGAGEEYYASRLLGLLEESVRLRMLSDVPVGVFLSGGVDSTANVALMSRAGGARVHTFTAGFQGQEAFDERAIARAAARHYGTLHDEIEITEGDLLNELPAIAGYLDEPVADATVIPIFYLSKLARQKGAVVILNGDGSDELFCGYRKYMQFLKLAPYWSVMKGMPGWARWFAIKVGNMAGVGGAMADLIDRASRGVEMYVGSTGSLKGTPAFREIIGNERGQGVDLYRAVREGRQSFMREHRSNDYAEWLSYWGVRSEVENVFLYRADRMGMANSVEIRVPFLDHHLVEFAMAMPQELKYRGGETKYILKKALEPVVPHEFLYRKKQGFCVPLREWSGSMMESQIRATLPRLRDDWGSLSNGFVESVLGMVKDGAATDREGALAWMLYNLAVWYERWFR
jgi:asparagine synthase (glutamine-hydrolysing)